MLRQLLVSCLAALALASNTEAASVRPLQLTQIIDDAAIAFQGTCVDNRTERDVATNFIVTYTTFAVKDVLKGTVPATYTIKQIGGTMPDGQLSYRVDGVPTFTLGQDYVVLLPRASSAGFSSPIGLSQGKFSVVKDAAGSRVANGRDFREMTTDMPSVSLPQPKIAGDKAEIRHLGLDDFKQIVRAHAGRPR